MITLNRRKFMSQSAIVAEGLSLGLSACDDKARPVLKGVHDFLYKVANKDGSFRPGIDPAYTGTSDTGLSGLAAPAYIDDKMRVYLFREQKEDGYLSNHVASTFHAAHYFRLIGQPIPKAQAMAARVIKDQM